MKKQLLLLLLCVGISINVTATEQNVVIDLQWGKLYGTLLTPDTPTDVAAIIIAGSGPTDRNGNNSVGITTNCYMMLAQTLQHSGIATFRYDKRGIGASRFENPEDYKNTVVFDDFIADAQACVNYLRAQGFKKIVMVGHSEGSLIALCAAKLSPDINGIVSLAGAGYTIDQILQTQLAAQLAMTDMGMLMQATAVLNSLKQGKTVDKYPRELESLFSPTLQPFLISWMQLDPQKIIRELTSPILIINGDNDIQVSVDNAEMLKKAQSKAQLNIIKDMTHVLKSCTSRDRIDQMTSVYTNSSLPLSDGLGDVVSNFIHTL